MQEGKLEDLLEGIKPLDFNDPKALAQLEKLKKHHDNIERIESNLEKAKDAYKKEAEIFTNMLDVLSLNEYKLPCGFRAWIRTHRDIVITDKAKFMASLKKWCTPSQIVTFLTPPTTMADLKRFITSKYEDNDKLDFELKGIVERSTYSMLKTEYKGAKNGHFKKKGPKQESKSYKHKRDKDYRCPKRAGKNRRNAGAGNVRISSTSKK